jgi:hypothetical protein
LALKVIVPSATQAAAPAPTSVPVQAPRREPAPPRLGPVEIHVHDARDPTAVAREVERTLSRLAGENDRYLSD